MLRQTPTQSSHPIQVSLSTITFITISMQLYPLHRIDSMIRFPLLRQITPYFLFKCILFYSKTTSLPNVVAIALPCSTALLAYSDESTGIKIFFIYINLLFCQENF